MNMGTKSQWSLGLLVATGAWAIVDVLADAHRRKRAKQDTVSELQKWEDEGGATRVAVIGHQ